MTSNKFYYPLLSDYIDMSDLPDFFSFLRDGLDEVFGNAFCRDYHNSYSADGTTAYYSLSVMLKKRLVVGVAGTGMCLVVNPSEEGMTEFPVTLYRRWQILRVLRHFDTGSFSYSAEDFFNAALDLFGLSEGDLLRMAMDIFVVPRDGMSPFKTMEADINMLYGTDIDVDEYTDDRIVQLAAAVDMIEGTNAFMAVFALYIGVRGGTDPAEMMDGLRKLFSAFVPDDFETYIKELLIPEIDAQIRDLSLGLEFPRSVLRPIDQATGEVYEDEGVRSMLKFTAGSVRFSTRGGLEFEDESSFDFTESVIGNTGFTLKISDAKMDLSDRRNIAEAEAAGYPADFMGVYVGQAEIGLPPKWFRQEEGQMLGLYGERMLIGTGGFSGRIGLRAKGGGETPEGAALTCRIGGENGFEIGFRSFGITLRQGMFGETDISGYIVVPQLKDAEGNAARLEMTANVDAAGEWSFTAREDEGVRVTLFGVLNLDLRGFSIGEDGGRFYAALSCGLSLNDIGGKDVTAVLGGLGVEISELRVWQDGEVSLRTESGGVTLKEPVKVTVMGKAEFTVSALHMGSEERVRGGERRRYMFLGLDCAIDTGTGGVDVKGNGLKFYFTTDGGEFDCFVKIEGISVDLTIPGDDPERAAVLLQGYLTLSEGDGAEGEGPEYTGGVTLTLPKLDFGVSANMRLMPKRPAFLADVDVNLPACIPLGPTGAGIYGFRGLTGFNYVADKDTVKGVASPEEGSGEIQWWQYYKAKIAPDYKEGVQVSKFSQRDGFALGAGMSLATAFDSGWVFSSKLFLLLSLPDVFLLEGQAAVLKQRVGLDSDDPPFYAMIAVSGESIEAAFGVDMSLPDSGSFKGWIAELSGMNEMAFYWGDAAAWHFYIGHETPEEKRVRAKVLKIFNAYMYLMLDKNGIRTGAGAGFDFGLYLGKKEQVGLYANAHIDLNGNISFRPMQIGGGISMGGSAGIKIFKFKLGIGLEVALSAEAPRPYRVSGEFSIKLDLPWPIAWLGGPYGIKLEWKEDTGLNLDPVELLDADGAKAVNMQTGEQFDLKGSTESTAADADIPLIPMDSYIDIAFKKGMGYGNAAVEELFGSAGDSFANTERIPPSGGASGAVTHTYELDNASISVRSASGEWQEYNPYEALRPSEGIAPIFPDGMMWGYWQCVTPDVHNRLRLFARSPLSYMKMTLRLKPEELGYEEGFLFCRGTERDMRRIRFGNAQSVFPQGRRVWHDGALFRLTDTDGETVQCTARFGSETIGEAMAVSGRMEITFPGKYSSIKVYLRMDTKESYIAFYCGNDEVDRVTYTAITGGTFGREYSGGIDRMVIYTPESDTASLLLAEQDAAPVAGEGGYGLLAEDALTAGGHTLLYGIDLLSEEDYRYNKGLPTLQRLKLMTAKMRSGLTDIPQPVWRPEATYRVAVAVNDRISADGGVETQHRTTYYYYFRTAGPNGFCTPASAAGLGNTVSHNRYGTLQDYIDFRHSYPAVNGNLTDSKPLYWGEGNMIRLAFLNDHAECMYNFYQQYNGLPAVGYELKMSVRDVSGESAGTNRKAVAAIGWNRLGIGNTGREIGMINSLARATKCSATNPDDCAPWDEGEIKQNESVFSQETGTLKPQSLYSVVYSVVKTGNGTTEEESAPVHEFVFQTSRYGSFAEHIGSFYGDGGESAVFSVEGEYNQEQMAAMDALADGAEERPADVLDRMLYGVLGIGQLPVAECVEVNLLRNGSDTVALLLRSPEPLFDPRIGADLLREKEAVVLSADGDEIQMTTLFSRDMRTVLMYTPSHTIPIGDKILTFRHLVYDVESDDYTVQGNGEIEFSI